MAAGSLKREPPGFPDPDMQLTERARIFQNLAPGARMERLNAHAEKVGMERFEGWDIGW